VYQLAGYGHSAFVFGNESQAKDAQVAPGDFCPSTLVDVVQKGIQYKELQIRLAANGSALRAYTAAELLRSKHPSDSIKAAMVPANLPGNLQHARPRFTDHSGHVYTLAWHPSEMVFASGASDASGRIYHVGDNPRAQRTCDLLPHSVPGNGPSADITGMSWSPQGNKLASVTLDGHMRIWGKNGAQQSAHHMLQSSFVIFTRQTVLEPIFCRPIAIVCCRESADGHGRPASSPRCEIQPYG
jgi:hypothetical protein